MKAVWKYEITPDDDVEISMPKGAQILTVQEQRGNACLWALVDTNETQLVARTFRLAGTGHRMDDYTGTYIGTFQMERGSLVFHLFEI